ncbi:rhodanese-like domain-containing protein [Breoghania sp.]|uniref:rhodanese-like domain-containing protein n=1 Tax=Breoghania sp. TaxID=2065378 RepID=UPI0029C8ADB2|nr:rhodanese-like domain-containing protein [Breoghania sp.]
MRIVYKTMVWVMLMFTAGLMAGGVWAQASSGQSISPSEFKKLLDARSDDSDTVLLDIRTPREFKSGHIRGAQLLDYYSSDFVERLKRLDREKTYLVYCRSGNRSGKSLKIFKQLGFRQVYHLDTGILGWLKEKYPLEN